MSGVLGGVIACLWLCVDVAGVMIVTIADDGAPLHQYCSLVSDQCLGLCGTQAIPSHSHITGTAKLKPSNEK